MAKQRLSQLDAQLNELKKEQAELTKQWEREREEMQRLQVNIHAFFSRAQHSLLFADCISIVVTVRTWPTAFGFCKCRGHPCLVVGLHGMGKLALICYLLLIYKQLTG